MRYVNMSTYRTHGHEWVFYLRLTATAVKLYGLSLLCSVLMKISYRMTDVYEIFTIFEVFYNILCKWPCELSFPIQPSKS